MRLRDIIPWQAVWLLMITLAVVAVVAFTDFPYPAETAFARMFYGWPKPEYQIHLDIPGLSMWLLLLAPCWSFAANLTQRESGPRLMTLLHRIGSRTCWYLRLTRAVVVWALTWGLVPAVAVSAIDGFRGLWPYYSLDMIRGWGQFFLFLLFLSILAMVAQLASGKTRAGFLAAFFAFMLPEIPIGLLSPKFYKMIQHYPMLIRSSLFTQNGYSSNLALMVLMALSLALWGAGFLFIKTICNKNMGG